MKNFEYISLRPNRVIANFEDDYNKVKFNNISLPGTDIDTNYNFKYIFLLGNSFIEALSVDENNVLVQWKMKIR